MQKLLKFEFSKLIKSKSFYICFAVCAIIVFATAFTIGRDGVSSFAFLRGYPHMSMITMLSCIPVAVFICEDAQSGTEKTILGRGVSRSKFFFAKYIVSLVAFLAFVIGIIGVSFLVGSIRFNYAADSTIVPFIFLSILGMIMFHAFFFGLSTIFGKNGIAIALGIIAPLVIQVAFNIFDGLAKIKGFTLELYSLNGILSTLCGFQTMNKDMVVAILLAIALSAIFVIGGFQIYKRKEN